LWFGGALEGRADICVYRSRLEPGAAGWGPAEQLTDDPARSEQNPLRFHAPDGRALLLHTAQPGGNQDACVVRMRGRGLAAVDLDLPRGSFVRGAVYLRPDGAWLLPLFHCVPTPGARWTGRHDTASVAISSDAGVTWRLVAVPGSVGCVHMTIVDLGQGRLAAFYRRRQADFVHRSESTDGGESWSEPVATDVPNNNSSIAVVRLADGRICMACNPGNAAMSLDRRASLYDELGPDDRPEADGGCAAIWGVARAPMVLAFSRDGGHSFAQRLLIEDGPGTCLTNDSLDGRNKELSYPSLSQGADGTLDLCYSLHRRAIRHLRLSPDHLEDTK
ncbi:MAG: exo-alpha-sialidase, partial [Paracoccaceae bacterium]|nr:exo-alpha-sialidase [Paracoccaceae bacterium]